MIFKLFSKVKSMGETVNVLSSRISGLSEQVVEVDALREKIFDNLMNSVKQAKEEFKDANYNVFKIRIDERIDSLEAHILSVEKDFARYAEQNPKISDDWAEARIRGLEEKVMRYDNEVYDLRNYYSMIGELFTELRKAKEGKK